MALKNRTRYEVQWNAGINGGYIPFGDGHRDSKVNALKLARKAKALMREGVKVRLMEYTEKQIPIR